MQTEGTSPPVGFRKAIPSLVKLQAVLLQEGRCPECGALLGPYEGLQFDHVPALGLRGWDATARDTIPPANAVSAIKGKHKDCHALKTFGRKGSSQLSRIGGDTSEIAKLRRIERKTEIARRRILAKDAGDDIIHTVGRKARWPKRKFQKKDIR